MSAVQLSFTLRTSANVKTVHLLGSWDNYSGQLPLSISPSGKSGAWKGTFRFNGSTLAPGQRYWYYYILDGYSVSHDPAKEAVKEPTTGRLLNVLDIPTSNGRQAPAALSIPQGRPISPSRIAHPKPSKPYASRRVREADYSRSPIDSHHGSTDELTAQLEAASLRSRGSPSSISSGSSGSSSGFSSGRSSHGRSGGPASPASLSSLSDASGASCRCNRYGITRSGKKVLLDCGGRRCGYSDDSSSGCGTDDSQSEIEESSEEEDDDDEEDSDDEEQQHRRPTITRIAPKGQTITQKTRIVQAAPRQVVAASRRR